MASAVRLASTSLPPSRRASSSPWTSRAARIARSTGWDAITTRTTSACPATATRSCSRATTRSMPPRRSSIMYSAASGNALWNDEGTLYAFVADDPNVNDYGDFPAANGASGHFVPVPPMIATGKRADGTDVRAVDFGYPAPPGRRSRTGRSGCSSTGATTSCARFSSSGSRTSPTTGRRRTSSTSPTAASRGRSRTARAASAAAPSGTRGPYPNGRIFKMVLDPDDPLDGAEPVDADRPRSARLRQPGGDAPAGQRRDDRERASWSRRIRAATTRAPSTATRRSGATRCRGGPFVPVAQVNQSPAAGPADRLVGVERDHRRFVGLRPRRVPARRAGARLGDRRRAQPLSGHRPQARGRAADAAPPARFLTEPASPPGPLRPRRRAPPAPRRRSGRAWPGRRPARRRALRRLRGAAPDDLGQRRVVEDHVRGALLRLRGLEPPALERLVERDRRARPAFGAGAGAASMSSSARKRLGLPAHVTVRWRFARVRPT